MRFLQAKTFCKWCVHGERQSGRFRCAAPGPCSPARRLNTKLETRDLPPMSSLARDLSDGVRLVELMEIMGDTSLGRYYRAPRMRVQMAENVNLALDFIRARGVVLTNVGAEGEWA
jgi:hypothetical protein